MDRSVRVNLSLAISDYVAKLQQASAATSNFADKTAKSMVKNKTAMDGVSTGLIAIGATAGVGAGLAIRSFSAFDKQMSSVQATGVATGSELGKLRKAAMDAGRAFGQFDATEAAQGVEQLAKAGLSASDIYGGGLTGALALAASGQMEVGAAAEVAAKTLKQFSLGGEDAGRVADLLAAGAASAVGDVSDLAMALSQGGTVAAQYGMSVEDTTTTLALFANNALLGSDAGTSLKTMLLQMADPTKEAQGWLDKLGISAYDTSGQFVGMRSFTEQLSTKLRGLSQEQQNAALKTIFGGDAVRAANVLVKEGTAGWDDMSQSVQRAGFAMQDATTRTDNLQGDLQSLQGAFDTLMIKLGSSADGPLRGMVQSVTGVVDSLGDLPGGAQAAIMGTGGLVAMVGLGAGAAVKAAGAFAQMKTSLDTAGISMKGVGVAGGVAGIALAGLGMVIGDWAQRQAEAKQTVDSLTGAIEAQGQVIGDQTRQIVANALEQSGALKAAQDLGISLSDMTEAALGNEAALRRVRDASNETSLEMLNYQVAAGGVVEGDVNRINAADKVNQALNGQIANVRDATEQAQRQAEALAGTSTELDKNATSAGKSKTAIDSAAAASRADAAAKAEQTQKLREQEQAIRDAQAAAQDYAATTLALSGGERGYEAALDAAAEALKKTTVAQRKSHAALDQTTKLGRDNRAALDQQTSSAMAWTRSLVEQGAPLSEIATKTQHMRDGLIRMATGFGMSATEARKLADSATGLPDEIRVKIAADAKAAKAEVADFMSRVRGVPPVKLAQIKTVAELKGVRAAEAAVKAAKGTVLPVVTRADTSGVAAAQRAVNGAKGKTVTVETRADTTGIQIVARELAGLRDRTVVVRTVNRTERTPLANAAGGPISGPGTGTSDSILSWVSNGEYVIRAAAAARIGLGRLDWINRHGTIPAFAGGGPVGGRYAAGGSVDTSGVWRELTALISPLALLATAIRTNTVAQQKAATANRAAAPAATEYRRALAARNATVASHKNEDAYYDTQIAAARKQGRGAAVKTLQGRKAANDVLQKKELAAVTTRLNKATARARPLTEAAAAASDRLREAQAALTEQQKALADSARQVSDTMMGRYGGMGGDVADWVASMTDGTRDLGRFVGQLQRLRAMGLSETVLQQIAAAGPGAGSDMAAEIISGGRGSVDALSKAAGALQTAADKLGVVQVTGVTRRAGGGAVHGPGTGTSDSITTRLSDGEYVLRSWASRRVGYDLLDYINRHGTLPPGLSGGGRVGTASAPAPRYGQSPEVIAEAVRRGLADSTLQVQIGDQWVDARITRVMADSNRRADLGTRLMGVI